MSKLKEISKKIGELKPVKKPYMQCSGVSNKTFVEINNKKYMIKGDNDKEVLAEIFCYRLGKRIGLNILPIYYIENNLKRDYFFQQKILTIQPWNDKFKTIIEEFDNEIDDEDIVEVFGEDGLKMLIFDAIINNDDRHQNNYGIIRNEKFSPVLIDHGLAKPWRESAIVLHENLRGQRKSLHKLIEDGLYVKEIESILETVTSITRDELEKMVADLRKYDLDNLCDKIVKYVGETISYLQLLLKNIEGKVA